MKQSAGKFGLCINIEQHSSTVRLLFCLKPSFSMSDVKNEQQQHPLDQLQLSLQLTGRCIFHASQKHDTLTVIQNFLWLSSQYKCVLSSIMIKQQTTSIRQSSLLSQRFFRDNHSNSNVQLASVYSFDSICGVSINAVT